MLQNDIINELQNIPEVELIKIYNFVHSIRLKFNNEFQQPIIQSTKKTASVKMRFEETPAFNLWKDRNDMQNVENYVANLRTPRPQNVY